MRFSGTFFLLLSLCPADVELVWKEVAVGVLVDVRNCKKKQVMEGNGGVMKETFSHKVAMYTMTMWL